MAKPIGKQITARKFPPMLYVVREEDSDGSWYEVPFTSLTEAVIYDVEADEVAEVAVYELKKKVRAKKTVEILA